MFSGIVEEMGYIKARTPDSQGLILVIQGKKVLEGTQVGDSISVNGVCLTVTEFDAETFTCQAIPETLAKTNLRAFMVNSPVNLERAMTLQTRLGGHFVQGHIDCTTPLLHFEETPDKGCRARFALPLELANYIVDKGYITIDGMSLTIADCQKTSFEIAFIPHTRQHTIVQFYQPNQRVNLEVDVLAKYVQRQIELFNTVRQPS